MSAHDWIAGFLEAERLPAAYASTIEIVHAPLARHLARRAAGSAHLVGLCGSQGSGKSTMAASLRRLLEEQGLSCAVLSIDDLYLTRAERERLAREVHPLLRTRGVPGTHDVALGLEVLAALGEEREVALPAFDKQVDDRRARAAWPAVLGPVDVVLLEGWCVGAAPQAPAALWAPINALERDEDVQGTWRRYVNDALAGPYRALFGRIGTLVLLRAPGFERVLTWRLEQEQKLRERVAAAGADASRLMDEAQLRRFVSHYERITRHILQEMPARADVVLDLSPERAVLRTDIR